MKTNRFSIVAAAIVTGAAAMSSCILGGGEIENSHRAATVSFTGGIEDRAVTRAAGTKWGANDRIGIFMVEKGTTTVSGDVANRQYTTASGTGSFTPVSATEAVEFPSTSAARVDFVAYYPWTNRMALGTPMAVQVYAVQTTANQPAFDILWGSADNSGAGYANTYTGTVALNFTHRLSKIVLDVSAEAGIGTLEGMTVKVNGLNISGEMSLATGSVSSPAAVTEITMRTVTDGSVYDAIVIPATYAAGDATLEFVVGGKSYTCDLPAMTYASANEYLYAVKIAPGDVTISGTIRPWTTNNAGSLTAQ
jgi:hypothetical protein